MLRIRPLTVPFVMLAATLPLTACDAPPPRRQAIALLNDIIVRTTDTGRAREFRRGRNVYFMDVDLDGVRDAVGLFTLRGFFGDDDSVHYLTVLLARGDDYREAGTMEIGRVGEREVDFTTLRLVGDALVLDVLDYSPDDRICCPSLVREAVYFVSGDVLREVPRMD